MYTSVHIGSIYKYMKVDLHTAAHKNLSSSNTKVFNIAAAIVVVHDRGSRWRPLCACCASCRLWLWLWLWLLLLLVLCFVAGVGVIIGVRVCVCVGVSVGVCCRCCCTAVHLNRSNVSERGHMLSCTKDTYHIVASPVDILANLEGRVRTNETPFPNKTRAPSSIRP